MRNNILIGIITLFCFSLFANPPKPVKNKNQQFKNKETQKKKIVKEPSAIEQFEKIKNVPFKELESYLNGSRMFSLFDNIDYLQKRKNIKDFCLYRKFILFRVGVNILFFEKERQKLLANIPNKIGINNGQRFNTELDTLIVNLNLLYTLLNDSYLISRARDLDWTYRMGDLGSYCDLLLEN